MAGQHDFKVDLFVEKTPSERHRLFSSVLLRSYLTAQNFDYVRPRHSEWSEAESNCEAAPNEVRWNLRRTGINRVAVMRRSVA